MSVNYSHNSI